VAGLPLTLTKPLGVGVLNNRHKSTGEVFDHAVASMASLNRVPARRPCSGAQAATDVTGFGLLGHLYKMMRASGTTAVVDAAAVPYLDGARDALRDGYVSGGTKRNLDWVRPHLASAVDDDELLLLADAQTSGGLLVVGEVPGHPVVGQVVARTERSSRSAERRPESAGSAGLRGVLRLVLEVEVPVRRPDEDHRADEVAEEGPRPVAQDVVPAQARHAGEDGRGQEEHVRDDVVEAHGDEGHDGEDHRQDLAADAVAAMAIQTARHTSQLAPRARRKTWYDDSSSAFFSAMPASRS
jgi:hypothetical protein